MPDASTATVETSELTVAYGQDVGVRDVTLTLSAGTVTAVIGPNGSGKSTLLSALAGLLRPARGSVRVLGRRPRDMRHRVAYVLQSTRANDALPVTVREVVRMGRYARRGTLGRMHADDHRAVQAALDRMEVAALHRRHLRELSAGQRQRVFVAQGLAQDADVLLLDEPVTGLDLVTQQRINTVLEAERDAGRTVVITTHELGAAAAADHVVLLATRLLAAGPPDEVLTAELLEAAYGGVHVTAEGGLVVDDPHHHDHGPVPTAGRHPRLRPGRVPRRRH